MSTHNHRSKLATIAGIVLSSALMLSACSSDNDADSATNTQTSNIPDVDISYSITDDTQEVTIDGDIDAEEPTAWIIAEGDNDVIAEGDLLEIHTANVDLENTEITVHDFDLGGQTLELNEEFAAVNPQAYEALIGATVGSDLAYYVPAGVFGENTPALFNIIAIQDIVSPYATGDDVPATELNDSLPEVTLDESTHGPTIATPQGEAPEELVVDVLKQGDGREVQSGSKVTIHYRGIKWSDGEEFDSSWGPNNTGSPTSFELQQLIAGWQEGLAGQNVGSQVIMSIPPELAYGNDGHDLAGETLVFVIDILHSAGPVSDQ